MTIQHRKGTKKGMFYVDGDGRPAAEMVYSISPEGRMVIEHTEVSDELRGHHIGEQLVKAGVEYAREEGMKIIPLCPFAKALIDRKPEWADVLA